MLREMGVQVWLPETPVAAEPAPLAAAPTPTVASTPIPAAAPAQPVPSREPVRPPPPQTVQTAATPGAAAGSPWRLGEAQGLYADSAVPAGARWLVLAEMPAEVPPEAVFQDDAGKLLDNMLRAARLHLAGAALFAPLVRHAAAAPDAAFSAALAALVAQAQPDIVLLMGRLASQALLGSSEPLGKLRGRAHSLHGAPVVVTYDAAYLLRTPADKARAWQDLRLAMRLAQAS